MKKQTSAESPPARPAPSRTAPAGARRPPRAAPGDPDEIAPEYDFRGARANPYAARYAAGATAVVLDPDVAAAFPSAARVNEVLRAVAGIIQTSPPATPATPATPAKPRRPRRSA